MTLPYKPPGALPLPPCGVPAPDPANGAEVAQDANQGPTSAIQSYAKSSGSALVTFFVPGKPAKKGSHNSRAFVAEGGQLGSYTYDADKGLTKWAKAVRIAAMAAVREQRGTGYTPTTAPVLLRVTFLFARPKSHGLRWGRGGKERRLPPATSRALGDCSKLVRAVEDPMTGVVWQDDSQVVQLDASKAYCEAGEVPGARVVVLEVQM